MDEIVPIVTSCIAAVISIVTLFYLIFSSRRTSITQTISKERMDWIRQTRSALMNFECAYRNNNTECMKASKALLESLMRRDTPEYCMVLDHVRKCMLNEYNDKDYSMLIGLTSYILSRAWERVKIDGSSLMPTGNAYRNRKVSKKTEKLLTYVIEKDYLSTIVSPDDNQRKKKKKK